MHFEQVQGNVFKTSGCMAFLVCSHFFNTNFLKRGNVIPGAAALMVTAGAALGFKTHNFRINKAHIITWRPIVIPVPVVCSPLRETEKLSLLE